MSRKKTTIEITRIEQRLAKAWRGVITADGLQAFVDWLGVSWTDFAAQLGIHPSTIRRWWTSKGGCPTANGQAIWLWWNREALAADHQLELAKVSAANEYRGHPPEPGGE